MWHLSCGSNVLEPSSNCPTLYKTLELNMFCFVFFKFHTVPKTLSSQLDLLQRLVKGQQDEGEMNYDFPLE